MQSSQIPSSKFPVPFANAAGASYKRAIPTTSQIGVIDGAASLPDGFPPLNFVPVGGGGVPPFGQDMNGLQNQITAWTRWQNAGGAIPWDSAFSAAIGGYPLGAIVAAATLGYFWLCTAENNTTNPDTGGAGWTKCSYTPANNATLLAPYLPLGLTAHGIPGTQVFYQGYHQYILGFSAVDSNTFVTSTFSGGAFTVGAGESGFYAISLNLNELSTSYSMVGLGILFYVNSGAFTAGVPNPPQSALRSAAQTTSSSPTVNSVQYSVNTTITHLSVGDVVNFDVYLNRYNLSTGTAAVYFSTDNSTNLSICRVATG